jgi:iron complex outermembrane receptor protein/vitamin B12 transporter
MEPLPVFRPGRTLAGLILAASLAFAQSPQPDNQNPTIVTVAAQGMPLSEVPASVTVLSRDYIDSSHADNAADLLRAAPFLQIAQTGAGGGLTTVSIRGAQSNFTLVMIDGIPVNDSTNILGGAFDLTTLPVSNIEQVEIVRGPLSSIYGSDAIGGVINFISRKGAKKSLIQASGELGNFLRRQFQVGASGTWKALQYSVGGSRLDVGQQVLDDGYSVSSLSFAGSVTLTQHTVLDVTARWLDDASAGFPTASGGPEFALLRQPQSDDAKELILGTSLKGQARPWWTYDVNLDWIRRTDDNFTPAILDSLPPGPGSQPDSVSDSDFRRVRFNAGSRFKLDKNLAFSVNAGLRREDGDVAGTLYGGLLPQSYTLVRNTFLGNTFLEYSNGRLTATAGLSFDKTEGFGEVTTPRVGLNWLTSEHGPRLKTTWGKGYKLPSFYSYGNPLVGNKSLRPERANSFDAGIEQTIQPAHTTLSATWFRSDYRDLIGFDSSIFKLVNQAKQLNRGVEFGADWNARAKFTFGLDVTWMTWKLDPDTQPLRDTPHANGGVHLDWKPVARFRARAETQWMGRRYDFQVPVPDIETVGGYSNTNLAANYDLTSMFSIYFRAQNLFDSGYHEFIGFPNPGIAVQVGLQFRSQK